MYTGGAGGYSFYVRGGEQVVRQRRNNSNYGESASRSQAQMERRVKWGNLVNVYKCMSAWQPKAYEFKEPGQTDYNIFMSMNIGYTAVGLTKDMANNGCAVLMGYSVSRGSLPPVDRAPADAEGGLSFSVTITEAPSASTTVGQFAADIIAHNPAFQANDNLAFVLYINYLDNRGYPYLTSQYTEVTLNPNDTKLLQSVPLLDRIFKSDDNELSFRCGASRSGEAGLAVIHTRREGGILKVSTQSVQITGEYIWDQFSYDTWIEQCILSYGLDTAVPLDPGVGPGGGDFPTTYVIALTGNGDTAVVSPKKALAPGHYVLTTSPDSWDVSGLTGNPSVVAVHATNADSSVDVFQAKSLTQFETDGGTGSIGFDIPENATLAFFVLRAAVGTSITFSLVKV